MRRIVLSVFVLAFLLAAFSSFNFADAGKEGSPDDKVNPADIVKMLEQQKQERIDQLWKEVKESVAKKDYETAISKLEEILKLDETSQDAAKILTMLKESTPSVPAPAPVSTRRAPRRPTKHR